MDIICYLPASCVVYHACCRWCSTDDTLMIMTTHGQNEHRTAFDIVWTIDLGAGMNRNGVLSKRRLEPRIHNFLRILSVMLRRCKSPQMKGFADNPTMQIANIDNNH